MTVADLIRQSRFSDDIHVFGPELKSESGEELLPIPPAIYHKISSTPKIVTRREWHRGLSTPVIGLEPDVVIVEQSPNTARFVRKLLPSARVLLHRHDAQHVSSPFKRLIQNHWMRTVDRILANSEFTRLHHVNRRGQDPNKVITLYNGINIPDVPDAALKKKEIICVAAMVPKKGADIFVDAAIKLHEEHPDWQCQFVSETSGKAPEGYREKLFKVLDGASEFITHHDFVPHARIIEMYQSAQIAVVPSQVDEAFGKTAAEAIACGCAVVHSGRGGLNEVAGGFGFIPKSQTPEAYALVLAELMADEEARTEVAEKASVHLRQNFEMGKIAERFDEIILEEFLLKTVS